MHEDGKAATRVERGFDFGDQVVVRVAKTWQLSDGERGGEAHGQGVSREGALPRGALHEQGEPG